MTNQRRVMITVYAHNMLLLLFSSQAILQGLLTVNPDLEITFVEGLLNITLDFDFFIFRIRVLD